MKLDTGFIMPFVEGTVHTLKVQCNIDAKVGKPYVKRSPDQEASQIEITGLIGITSPTFKGSISLCFPEKTFLGIMGKMLGETYTAITPDVEDGAGELTNIIFGAAKRVLNDKGHKIDKALPSVIRGSGLKIRHLTPTPTLVMPFETEVGSFQIEIAMDASAAAA